MKEQQGGPRPWKQIDDVVVDAHGRIVKAPHGCSWEGDNYNDGATAAAVIVEAVNNSRQPHPVPEGYVLVPVDPTDKMVGEAHSIDQSHGSWPRALWERLLAAAPKPGADDK